jgi:hypothetical protein
MEVSLERLKNAMYFNLPNLAETMKPYTIEQIEAAEMQLEIEENEEADNR